MTNCRPTLLAVVIASLVYGLAQGQVPFESSRNNIPVDPRTAPAQQGRSLFGAGPPAIGQSQNPAQENTRPGWLQRLVLGKSEEPATARPETQSAPLVTNTRNGSPVQAAPVYSSRQPGAIASAAPASPAPAANKGSSNWLRQLVLGKPDPTPKAPAGNAATQAPAGITDRPGGGAIPTGAISSRIASTPSGTQPPTTRMEIPAAAEAEKTSWLNRLSWRKPSDPPSSRSAAAHANPAAKTASRWSHSKPDNQVAMAQAPAAGQSPIKRLPEVAAPSMANQPGRTPAQPDSSRIASSDQDARSGSLSSWFSRFQRRDVDQASAVTGANTNNARAASRTIDSEIIFQGPPSTSFAGATRLPPPDAVPPIGSTQANANRTSQPNGTPPRSTSWLSQQFSQGLASGGAEPLTVSAPEAAKTNPTAPPQAPAGATSRRLPPPAESSREPSRLAGTNSSPALIPPTVRQPDVALKLEPPKAPRFTQSIASGARSSISSVNPFNDESAPRTIHELHAEIMAQQPQVTASDTTATGPYARPKIIFRPIAMNSHAHSGHGHALLKPEAHVVSQDAGVPLVPPQTTTPDGVIMEDLPPPDAFPSDMEYMGDEEWMPMGSDKDTYGVGGWKACWYRLLANLNGPRSCPPGIGVENVMNAPFWLDTTQPLNNCVVRGDAAADWEFPDRLEYFWSKTPGPKGAQGDDVPAPGGSPFNLGEPEVDYQDIHFYIERGGDRFSVGTLLPIRAIDPVDRRNTAGFADMRVTPKMVLLDGKDWQLSHVFHTHIPTGSFRRGTGNGHVSLEPGVAWRYKWSDVTYFHGDLTYWFPIAADLDHAGQFLNYGIGISHVLYDSDCYAIMPTFEVNVWTLLDGRETLPGQPMEFFNEIDTYSIINLHPGLRIVCDTSGDCGVREFGITSGVAVTQEHWYQEIVRIELRWVF